MKRIIHVNRQIIAQNRKNGTNLPPLTAKSYKDNIKAHEIAILDDSGATVAVIKHSPHEPLSCGARVWIETHNEIKVLDNEEQTSDMGRSNSQRNEIPA